MWHRKNAKEGDVIRIVERDKYNVYKVGDVGVATAALKTHGEGVRGIIAQFFRPFEGNHCYVSGDHYEVKERNSDEG